MMNKDKTWRVEVRDAGDDVFIPLPEDALAELGWRIWSAKGWRF